MLINIFGIYYVTCCFRTHSSCCLSVSNSEISIKRLLHCTILLIEPLHYALAILCICFWFYFNMEKVTLEQRTSKLISYLVVTGMSIVYWLKIYLRFLKLKHTVHSIIMILSTYQKPIFDLTILEGD